GETLRDARMRARIDISEIEAETKIRAKYLRALENEEWDLLPGPTYVKSFLRTYADALGLDAKLLIEEYKLRHERLSEVERQPIVPTGIVWVCLEAAGRRRLVNAQELKPGPRQPVYRSSAFRITLGNNNAELRVNGRVLTVPDVSSGIGYKITGAGRRVLTP